MVKLYVEGGGDTAALRTACREGFTTFITKSGVRRRPRIVACGSRQDAYDSFCTAIAHGEEALLLVDSEAPIADEHQNGGPGTWRPWQHLKDRIGDHWTMPPDARESDCHLMVQCMESWFIADRAMLSAFYGNEFQARQLPDVGNPIEQLDKQTLYTALANATRKCQKKGAYGKGEHSFKLLASIDPLLVVAASPWAKRFIDELKNNRT